MSSTAVLKNAWMLICMTWNVFYLLLNLLQTRAHHHSKYHRDLLMDLSRHAAIWAGCCFLLFTCSPNNRNAELCHLSSCFRKWRYRARSRLYWNKPSVVYEGHCPWKAFKAVTNGGETSQLSCSEKEEVMLVCFRDEVVTGSPPFFP